MARDWKSAYAEMHRDGAAVFPPAGLAYVLQTVRRAASVRIPEAPALTPEEIITTFRTGARADFGPLLPQVLRGWNLDAPEDLGRAVLLLGRYECLSLEDTDTLEAFSADIRPFAAGVAA
jgi:uncharacterized repeat protein (TIGR04138 family)